MKANAKDRLKIVRNV